MTDVFISYRRAPSASLAQLIQVLLRTNHSVDAYLDVTRADSAIVQFPDRLMQAIDDAPVFVCLLGDVTLDSEWVLKEIHRAYERQKPCIPVFQESYVAYAGTDPAIKYLLGFDGVHVFDVKNIHTEYSVTELVKLLPKTGPQPTPKTATLSDAIQALEADDFDHALDLLNALKQSGSAKYANLDQYISIAQTGQAIRESRSQAQHDYDELLMLANSRYGVEQAKASWPHFCADYPDMWRPIDQPNRLDRRFFVTPQPFAWVKIPAGKVMLITEDVWADNYVPKGEPTPFDVPAFDIAKYPVTVAQYELFIQDNGYQNDQWWGGLAERFDAAQDLPDFSRPDHPRVNVNWFESIAFCRWLSDRTGLNIALPTEQMWQHAAQGDDNRVYPWGTWEDGRCNVEKKHNGTTAVTQYEDRDKGDSPYGVSDMVGNVWEWCLTAYETGDTATAGDPRRVFARRVVELRSRLCAHGVSLQLRSERSWPH